MILEHGPAAIEVMDKILLDLARDTLEFKNITETIPEKMESILLVEFYVNSKKEGKEKVNALIKEIVSEGEGEGSRERRRNGRWAGGGKGRGGRRGEEDVVERMFLRKIF